MCSGLDLLQGFKFKVLIRHLHGYIPEEKRPMIHLGYITGVLRQR